MADYQSISHTFVDRPKTQVTKDRAYTLTCKLYLDNSQDVVASGTITILGPGGGALPGSAVSGAAVTVDGSGTCTYTLSAANAATLGSNYTAQWVLTDSNADVHEFLQLFDVVEYPLHNMVIQADLVKHHPDLTNHLFSGESDAQAYIEMAFEDVYATIEANGLRPWLVLGSHELRRPTEHLALAKLFLARVNSPGDKWDRLHDYHSNQFQRWFSANSKKWAYDIDQSGTVSGTVDYEKGAGEEGGLGSLAPRIKV